MHVMYDVISIYSFIEREVADFETEYLIYFEVYNHVLCCEVFNNS